MSYYVLWIDHDHAKIFDFSPEGQKIVHLENNHQKNHHSGHFENQQSEQQKKFYKEVGANLTPAGKILLVGPSQAHLEFKKHIDSHQQALSKAIIGMETLDQMTEGEVRNFAHKYFHRYNLFN